MDLTALFSYEHAANRQILAAMRETDSLAEGGLAERAHVVAAHLLAAQRVWLERLTGDSPQTPVWPDLTADQRDDWLAENARRIGGYLAASPDLDAPLRYHSTSGIGYESTPREILMHLLLHGSYHRGQLAAAIREAGGVPPKTDLIVHLRQLV